jgi:hypothetical protein
VVGNARGRAVGGGRQCSRQRPQSSGVGMTLGGARDETDRRKRKQKGSTNFF